MRNQSRANVTTNVGDAWSKEQSKARDRILQKAKRSLRPSRELVAKQESIAGVHSWINKWFPFPISHAIVELRHFDHRAYLVAQCRSVTGEYQPRVYDMVAELQPFIRHSTASENHMI